MRFAVALLGFTAPAFAQGEPARSNHPVFLVGGQDRRADTIDRHRGCPDRAGQAVRARHVSHSSRVGLLGAGSAGTGGWRVAAGGAALALEGPFLTTGFDALFTVTRTTETPRDAAAASTYVGGEAGMVIMSVRLSAGVARRAAGTPGPKATIFTWGVGVQIPLGW